MISGGGDLDLNISSQELGVKMTGGGNATLSGATEKLSTEIILNLLKIRQFNHSGKSLVSIYNHFL